MESLRDITPEYVFLSAVHNVDALTHIICIKSYPTNHPTISTIFLQAFILVIAVLVTFSVWLSAHIKGGRGGCNNYTYVVCRELH